MLRYSNISWIREITIFLRKLFNKHFHLWIFSESLEILALLNSFFSSGKKRVFCVILLRFEFYYQNLEAHLQYLGPCHTSMIRHFVENILKKPIHNVWHFPKYVSEMTYNHLKKSLKVSAFLHIFIRDTAA